jgi:hypothetical protein
MIVGIAFMLLNAALAPALAQGAGQTPTGPWMDKSLPPDRRAGLVMEQMTLDEKLVLVHGGAPYSGQTTPQPAQSLGGAGFVPGIPRLGIPDFQMTDGRSGVANTGRRGRYATALPSSLAAGATWDVKLAHEYGALIGKETRALGFNVSLGGTANLIREPRNGRNFECWSEDPIAIGKMLGRALKAIREKAPKAKVEYGAGTDPASAAKLAAASEVAIVFVNQHTTEGRDVASLSPPDNQDQLISQIAAANPHTIVVLETGGPVTMPWIDKVSGVLEVWYPGIRGAEATADILFGSVNPSGKLPVTFPKSEADLPHPVLPGSSAQPSQTAPAGRGGRGPAPFDVDYTEGLKTGYKWFDAENKEPLFPFGFGLSYTTFSYSRIRAATSGRNLTVTRNVRNAGKLAGAEVVQVYVSLPANAGEPPKRLVAWDKMQLGAGASKVVTLTVDPLHLSIFDVDKDDWVLLPGEYKVFVGGSSRSTPLSETALIAAAP